MHLTEPRPHPHRGARGVRAREPARQDEEVLRASGQVKTDQVGAEQAVDDLRPPRHLHEQLDRGGKRDVQEEPDGQVGGAQHAQHLGHQLQLVVLHPDGGAFGGGARGRVGETPVDLDVAVPPLPVVDRFDDHVVVERPQRGVREAS